MDGVHRTWSFEGLPQILPLQQIAMHSKWSIGKGANPGDSMHLELRQTTWGQQPPLVSTKLTHDGPLHSPQTQNCSSLVNLKLVSKEVSTLVAIRTHSPVTLSFFYPSMASVIPCQSYVQEHKSLMLLHFLTIEVDFSSEKKSDPELLRIKASLASSTSNLTEECIAFSIKRRF